MKMKRTVLLAIAVIMAVSFVSASAWAGSKQRHRWEGVAIGVGAALVGGAIINSYARGPYAPPPVAVSVNYVEQAPAPVYYVEPPPATVHYHSHEHHRVKHCEGRPYKHCYRKACHHRGHRHHVRHHQRCDD